MDSTEEQTGISPTDSKQALKQTFFSEKKKVIFGLIILLVAAIVGRYLFVELKFRPSLRPSYALAQELVQDQVSKSANIVINLPSGVGADNLENRATFTPEIKGEWSKGAKEGQLIFLPKKDLKVGKYYAVSITVDSGTVGKDFLVVDDPEVAAVFPSHNSEAHENSDITVVFNRPIVPVTTLDILQEHGMPITIEPATAGKYKWVGTRTVQFIPKDRLIRSSHYTVKTNSDIVSTDGLSIEPSTTKFITRPLRYLFNNNRSGTKIYNQPASLRFNQPVDLARTKKEISVTNNSSKIQVDVVFEYGTKFEYDKEAEEEVEVEDKSVINVYQKRDQHGRNKVWDFNNSYSLTIKKAYPAEGDIDLNENRVQAFNITGIIESITATSERSNMVSQNFFDPEGELIVTFYEEVDLDASDIKVSKLKDISYAEKCADEFTKYRNQPCPKVQDKKKIIFSFNSGKVSKGELISIEFKKVVNLAGFKINPKSETREVIAIPEFNILRTIPANNEESSSVTELIVCSNSPLAIPGKEDLDNFLAITPEYEFKSWLPSQRVPSNTKPSSVYPCKSNEFQTRINYGLMPSTNYQASLDLVDHFGQISNQSIFFVSGKVPDKSLNFFHFQKKYNVTTPEKTALTYAVENMEYVNLSICRLSAPSMLYQLENKLKSTESAGVLTNCLEKTDERIALEPRFWIKNYFTVDLNEYVGNPIGHYVLTFSHPDYKTRSSYSGSPRKQVYEHTYLTVTNLGVVEKKVELLSDGEKGVELSASKVNDLSSLYWVTNLTTLEPVEGAIVDLYSGIHNSDAKKTRFSKITSANTNSVGVARANPFPRERSAIVYSGEDSALTVSDVRFNSGSAAQNLFKLYVYTDRPIYRPGHSVEIKGLHRFGFDGKYEIDTTEKLEVKIFDSTREEIHSEEVTLNEFGTFNTSFTLANAAPLGSYRIQVDDNGYASFSVEEYVGAPFKAEATTNKEEYIAGDTFDLKIDADYYFGVPLEGGTVEYSIVSQSYYFDKYQGEYFQFGRGWYRCYYFCRYGDQFVLRGSTTINEKGEANISKQLDFKSWFPKEEERGSKIILVRANVKNSSGEAIAINKSFIVHAGEYYLGLKANPSYVSKDEEVAIKLKSVDTLGKELKVRNLDITYNKVRYVTTKRQGVNGIYTYKWEKELEELKAERVSTNRSGDWSGDFTPPEEGEYEIIVRGTDSRDNAIISVARIYVHGQKRVDIRPSNNTSLEIEVENSEVEAGGQASFIIKSPYKNAKALITVERGNIYSYEVVNINQSFYKYSFPITEEYIPNIYASVVLVSNKPEVKHGSVSYSVNTKEKELEVTVSSNKQEYLPGEEVILNFTAQNSRGQGVETEFSAAVIDLSVLALKGNPKKNPLRFFYGGFPLTVSTFSNVKNILYKVDIPVGSKGGGGGDAADLARKKRGEFRDTAYWQAAIKTDKNGKVEVRFNLPDNLTTWQVESVGITKDTLVGVDYDDFLSRKEVMVVPLKPRFILPGDEFMVGAKVFNRTNGNQKLEVTYTSETLESLEKKDSSDITVPANESKTVHFKVKAPVQTTEGLHYFTLSAKNKNYEDTVEQSIVIKQNNTYETTATGGYTKDATLVETLLVPGNVDNKRGGLTIRSSATLAVFLSDAFEYMLEFPYYSAEQAASKLETIAILKRASSIKGLEEALPVDEVKWRDREYTIDEAVQVGLQEIYNIQNRDGGFNYYKGAFRESNTYLSIHIAEVFEKLEQAGYEIEEKSLQRLYNFLNAEARKGISQKYYGDDTMVLLAARLIALERFGALDNKVVKRVKDFASDSGKLEKASNTSLTKLALLVSKKPGLFGKRNVKRVISTLENRIEIDARGAHLGNTPTWLWRYYQTPVRDTALFIKVLTQEDRDNKILDRMLRWLLASRAKDGSWGSTPNTLTVADALTEFLILTKETESDFTLTTLVDTMERSSFRYKDDTVLTQSMLDIPIWDLPRERASAIRFNKENYNERGNTFYYDIALRYFLPVKSLPPRDEGMAITRKLYAVADTENKQPLNSGKVGDVLRVHSEIIIPKSRNFVALEDFIPAGAEIINFSLATEDQSTADSYSTNKDNNYNHYREPLAKRQFRANFKEARDDRYYAVADHLSPGVYTFDYYIRLLIPGSYQHLPAVISEDYFPENFGRTGGSIFTIEP